MLSTGAGDETLLSARFICVSARTPGLRAPEGWLLSARIGPAGGCGAGAQMLSISRGTCWQISEELLAASEFRCYLSLQNTRLVP